MSESKRILLTGASGLIGSALVDHYRRQGHEVNRLVRRDPQSPGEFDWDPYSARLDDRALKGIDVAISLSGAGIGTGRWTNERKETLYHSRITPTRFLAESLAKADEPPSVFISQSAIGIYGERDDEILTEQSSPGSSDDFLVSLTLDWEAAARPAVDAGIRVLMPRTGLVLDRRAQLLKRLLPLFKTGLGGPLGSGAQWWSWITMADNIRAIDHLANSSLDGPVNLVGPNPVTQREFAKVLGKVVGRPALVKAPATAMRIALGAEKAEAIGLSSTRVVPKRLRDSGFRFQDVDLEASLRRILT